MINVLPHERIDFLSKYMSIIEETEVVKFIGYVDKIIGLTIESVGPNVKYGDTCKIRTEKDKYILAEVIGFRAKNRPVLVPIGDMSGVVPGAEVISLGASMGAMVGENLIGRVIDGIGNPIDGKGMIYSKKRYPIKSRPVPPLERNLVEKPLATGVRAIDGLLTIGRGQRIGIFSGSGVGKSTLMAMISKYTDADINVIALIGERNREVKDFVEKELGEEGMKKSIVIVATSDQPPMLRVRGAYLAHAIAEYFRDQGKSVNLLMDSVTRFAMAQREIGLAAGEPTASKGYPPSVIELLPKLLERSGNGKLGSITGFYTVLIEADDMNDIIADTVRGILDGHIILDRAIANKGHYPAIDVLASLSRCMKDVVETNHQAAALRFRELLSAYRDVEDMVMLGTYVRGSNPLADKAISLINELNGFLKQAFTDKTEFPDTVQRMEALCIAPPVSNAKKTDYVSSHAVRKTG